MNNELTDISGFVCNDEELKPSSVTAVLVSDTGNFRVYKVLYGGCWHAVKATGPNVSEAWGRMMLEREFRILSTLSHRSVVTAVAFEKVEGLGYCLVTNWIEGVPLDAYLHEMPLSSRELSAICNELIEAIAYIHSRGVVHRDLKPSNVMIDSAGHVQLIDFGLADMADQCLLKSVTGTPGFSAPEIAEGSADIDWYRADVYSLGVLLRMIKGDWSRRLLAKRCTVCAPERRPINGQAVARMLRNGRKRMHRVVASLAAIIAIVAIVLLARSVPHADREVSAETPTVSYDSDITGTYAYSTPVSDSISAVTTTESAPTAVTTSNISIDAHTEVIAGNEEVDVNFLLLRACALRDSIRHLPGRESEPLDTIALQHAIATMRQRAIKLGLKGEMLKHFDTQTTSTRFYKGDSPKFYVR